jgi:TfoX/Sxy family transcriptional regulator of competence genes
MPIDEELRGRLRQHLKGMENIDEKPMFGGICFMWRGNLLCGVTGQDLLVRIAKKDYDTFITDEGARPMVMAGKSGKSWILVNKSVVSSAPVMERWLDRARDFVGSLPAK